MGRTLPAQRNGLAVYFRGIVTRKHTRKAVRGGAGGCLLVNRGWRQAGAAGAAAGRVACPPVHPQRLGRAADRDQREQAERDREGLSGPAR